MKTLKSLKTGKTCVIQSAAVLIDAVESGIDVGFCIRCGEDMFHVEPDIHGSPCPACKDSTGLYGAEQLILMKLYYTDEEKAETETQAQNKA